MDSRPPTTRSQTSTHLSQKETDKFASRSATSGVFSEREPRGPAGLDSSDDLIFTTRPIIAMSQPAALQRPRQLRIELPNADFPLSPNEPADVDDGAPRTPQTTTMPRSPLSRAASEFVVDPNTAAILQEFRIQQSTMALLSVDLSTKSLIDAAKTRSFATPSKRNSELPHKRGPSFGLFRRGQRGSNALPGGPPPVSGPGERRRFSFGDEGPLPSDANPHVVCDQPIEMELVNQDTPSPKRPSEGVAAAGISSNTSNEDADVKEDGEGDTIGAPGGLENVLKEASHVYGIRLTWILYAMICIVIGLFIMLFIQITYMANGTLRRTGREAVQAKVSSLANNAEMLISELRSFYEVAFRIMSTKMNTTDDAYSTSAVTDLCSRLFGAPIAVNLYNSSGALLRRINCPGEVFVQLYQRVPTEHIVSEDGPRIVLFSEDILSAYRSLALSSDKQQLSTISVHLKRQTIGQFMLSNVAAEYSSAAMQDVYTTVVLPLSARAPNAGTLTVALRTLDAETTNYTLGDDSHTTAVLLEDFTRTCVQSSLYTWQKVIRPLPLDLHDDVKRSGTNEDNVYTFSDTVPPPRMEFKGVWGLLSKTVQCGVVCSERTATTCATDNPTNVYLMARYAVPANGWPSITTVAAVSIAAVVVFSFLLVLAYFSISTPVHFLRYQIMRIVGSDRKRTRLQRAIDRVTHRIWIGDMTALVRSVHVLGICFRVNKKYVPLHVLRAIADELLRQRLNVFEDYDVDNCDSDDIDSGPPGSPLQLVSESHGSDDLPLMANVANPAASTDAIEMEERQEEHATQRFNSTEPSTNGQEDGNARTVELATFSPLPLAGGTTTNLSGLRELDNSTLAPCVTTERPLADQSGVFGESMLMAAGGGASDLGASGAFTATTVRGIAQPQGRHMLMNINRDDGATILAVRIGGVDSAYLFNYSVTARNHQVIMAFLLRCIRHHKGAIFYRTGDCLGAVWNAFDSCANHAARAAACAYDMSTAFAGHRQRGLQVGIVLHQGNFVFGNVDDSKEAFATAFGEAPQQAITLADYAAPQSMLNVVVSEPVKQSLSTLYEFAIVDVVRVTGNSNHLILFDLCERREKPLAPHALGSPVHSAFAIEYTKAFSLFRDNRYEQALHTLAMMPPPTNPYAQRLVLRLEQLSLHFMRNPTTVTRPYCRPFPHWVNYEMMALADLSSLGAPRRYQSLQTNMCDLSTPVKTVSDVNSSYALPLRAIEEVGAKIEEADDVMVFKRDLHDNVRRLGTPKLGATVATGGTMPSSITTMSPEQWVTPLSHVTPISPVSPVTPMTHTQTQRVSSGEDETMALRDPPTQRESDRTSRTPLSPQAVSSKTNHPGSSHSPSDEPFADAPPLVSVGTRWTMEDDPIGSMASSTSCEAAPPAFASLPPPGSIDVSPGDSTASGPLARGEMEARRATSFITALSGSVWHDDGANRSGGPALPATAGTMTEDESMYGNNNSATLARQPSFIQSVSFTLDATVPMGTTASAVASVASAEIHARNGNTYLRSGRLLGRGSFGSVYMGVDVNSGKLVAVKYLPLRPDESDLASIEAEVMIMQRVKDSHVVEFISYAFQDEHIVLIMECMMAGSLQNMISAFHALPSSTARVFIRDVLRGLNKLHSMGVVHRDVKPQNVLLTLSGSCKISDFGASASIQELARKDSEGRVCGTPVYLAPEAAQGKPVKKSDIWSCGIMFLQLLTGKLPYAEDKLCIDAPLLVYQIGSYIARPIIPENLDEMDVMFVRACLRQDAAARPTAAQLLQMPLFAL